MPELGLPAVVPPTAATEKKTAEFGEYVFPLPKINVANMKPEVGGLLDILFISLAYLNDPRVNSVLTAYGIQIQDDKGKALFPRSDT